MRPTVANPFLAVIHPAPQVPDYDTWPALGGAVAFEQHLLPVEVSLLVVAGHPSVANDEGGVGLQAQQLGGGVRPRASRRPANRRKVTCGLPPPTQEQLRAPEVGTLERGSVHCVYNEKGAPDWGRPWGAWVACGSLSRAGPLRRLRLRPLGPLWL